MKYRFAILLLLLIAACQSDDVEDPPMDEPTPASSYFPPLSDDDWESILPEDLDWNLAELADLETFLIAENTKAFLVLHKGRIVVEEYYNGHSKLDTWPWNSAGKTLVSAMTGIAQQDGWIDIENKVSDYLGKEWTSTDLEKEDLITVQHLLSMTSGLDDTPQLVIRPNLTYLADAGTRWAYGNVFQRLMNVVEDASGMAYEDYFDTALRQPIGMEGYWKNGWIYRIYHSNARSMARFGILASHHGQWNGEQIINKDFFESCLQSSQTFNPSYGYLWWLNGQSAYMLPASQTVHDGELVPSAPSDMFAAMGKDEQRIYIVPSEDLIIVRMGEASRSGGDFTVSSFDNAFWQRFMRVLSE